MSYTSWRSLHLLVRVIACVDLIPPQGQRDLVPQFGKRVPITTYQPRANRTRKKRSKKQKRKIPKHHHSAKRNNAREAGDRSQFIFDVPTPDFTTEIKTILTSNALLNTEKRKFSRISEDLGV